MANDVEVREMDSTAVRNPHGYGGGREEPQSRRMLPIKSFLQISCSIELRRDDHGLSRNAPRG